MKRWQVYDRNCSRQENEHISTVQSVSVSIRTADRPTQTLHCSIQEYYILRIKKQFETLDRIWNKFYIQGIACMMVCHNVCACVSECISIMSELTRASYQSAFMTCWCHLTIAYSIYQHLKQ